MPQTCPSHHGQLEPRSVCRPLSRSSESIAIRPTRRRSGSASGMSFMFASSIRDRVVDLGPAPRDRAVQVAVEILAVDAVADDAPIPLAFRRDADVRHLCELVLPLQRFVDCGGHECATTHDAPELRGKITGITAVLQAHPLRKTMDAAL